MPRRIARLQTRPLLAEDPPGQQNAGEQRGLRHEYEERQQVQPHGQPALEELFQVTVDHRVPVYV
jgi:hypothetical protein